MPLFQTTETRSFSTMIESCVTRSLKAPLVRPFGIAGGEHASLENLLFTITLSNKITGQGEAAIAPHITGETIEGARKTLLQIPTWLREKPISDVYKITPKLREAFPKQPAACAAAEMAMMDALAKTLKVPLWKFFGNKAEKLTTGITIVIGTVEEARLTTRAYVKRGFRTFKIKIGRDKPSDLDRIRAVASEAQKSTFLLDGNQGFTPREIIGLIRELQKAKIKIDLIEQPVVKNDYDGLREVWKKTGIPVCADESASSLQDVLFLITNKIVPVINIKLMKFGLLQAAHAAHLAQASGTQIMVGQMMESALGTLAAAHFTAGIGSVDFVDLDCPFFIKGPLSKVSCLNPKGIYDLSCIRSGIGVRTL